MKPWLPTIIAFLISVAALAPLALTLPQQIDEVEYAYISAYYGGKIARLDFAPVSGADEFLDPGWKPITFWTLTQPMGPRYIYSAALGITHAPPPARPFILGDYVSYNPLTQLSTSTRNVMRFTALLLAALGLALIVHRFRWPAMAAVALFLLTPSVRENLALGWAEGPLLFGFGLASLAWGTRWFGLVCGVAATFKLTALGLWPLAFWHGLGSSRYRHLLGLLSAAITWTVLMPPAWFAGGPSYLVPMLFDRWWEFQRQSGSLDPGKWGGLFGHYFPTRYLWPFELTLLVTACVFAPRLWSKIHRPAVALHLHLDEGTTTLHSGTDR